MREYEFAFGAGTRARGGVLADAMGLGAHLPPYSLLKDDSKPEPQTINPIT